MNMNMKERMCNQDLIHQQVNNNLKEKNGQYLSSKKDHKALGLLNIKQAVSKYDGDIDIQVEQEKFIVSIMFPTSN